MKWLVVMLVIAMLVPGVAWAEEPDEYTATFFFAATPSDGGWNFAHDKGVRKLLGLGSLEEEWDQGFVVNLAGGTEYTQLRVHLVTDCGYDTGIEDMMRAAIEAQKPDMIFGTWWDSKAAIATLALEYPHILFNHCSGYPVLKSTDEAFAETQNVSTYFPRMYFADYLAGKVAGWLGYTSIGGVATWPIPEPVRGFNAFIEGVRKGREEAGLPETTLEFRLVWILSWLNRANEQLATNALIAEGYTLIRQGADTPTAAIVACEHSVPAIGYGSAAFKLAPCTLVVNEWDWGSYYVRQVQRGLDGTWEPEDWYEEGTKIVFNDSLELVPQKVRDAVLATPLEEIWSRDFHGYGYDMDGVEFEACIPGGTMTDEILLGMQVLDREIASAEHPKADLPLGVWIKYASE